MHEWGEEVGQMVEQMRLAKESIKVTNVGFNTVQSIRAGC